MANRGRCTGDDCHWRDELIALPRNGLDKDGRVSRVAERAPQLCHAEIEAAVEIDMRVVAPDRNAQRLPGDDFPGVLEVGGFATHIIQIIGVNNR